MGTPGHIQCILPDTERKTFDLRGVHRRTIANIDFGHGTQCSLNGSVAICDDAA
jgi:hypothetical protein